MLWVDKYLHVTPWTLTKSTTQPWIAVILRLHATDILVGTTYFPPDDPHTNMKTMQELAHLVGQVQCPYLIGGDYNTPPEGLGQYHWEGLSSAEILVPRDTPPLALWGNMLVSLTMD